MKRTVSYASRPRDVPMADQRIVSRSPSKASDSGCGAIAVARRNPSIAASVRPSNASIRASPTRAAEIVVARLERFGEAPTGLRPDRRPGGRTRRPRRRRTRCPRRPRRGRRRGASRARSSAAVASPVTDASRASPDQDGGAADLAQSREVGPRGIDAAELERGVEPRRHARRSATGRPERERRRR